MSCADQISFWLWKNREADPIPVLDFGADMLAWIFSSPRFRKRVVEHAGNDGRLRFDPRRGTLSLSETMVDAASHVHRPYMQGARAKRKPAGARYAAQIMQACASLLPTEFKSVSIKQIAAASGLQYPHAYAGVQVLLARGDLDRHDRKDAGSYVVSLPGGTPPIATLTDRQNAVLEALAALADSDGNSRASFQMLAKKVSLGSVSQILNALISKGRIKLVKKGDPHGPGVYRVL
jgi:hypothetical protein